MTALEKAQGSNLEWAKMRLTQTIEYLHEMLKVSVHYTLIGNGGLAIGVLKNKDNIKDFEIFTFTVKSAAGSFTCFGLGFLLGVFFLVTFLAFLRHEHESRRAEIKKTYDSTGVQIGFDTEPVKDRYQRAMTIFMGSSLGLFIFGIAIVLLGADLSK